MQNVFYAGTILTTGDDIADALLGVVMRVSLSGRPERVEVPCCGVGGIMSQETATSAELIVVPGAPILAVVLSESRDDLIDVSAVARLRGNSTATRSTAHEPEGSSFDASASYDFDEWI